MNWQSHNASFLLYAKIIGINVVYRFTVLRYGETLIRCYLWQHQSGRRFLFFFFKCLKIWPIKKSGRRWNITHSCACRVVTLDFYLYQQNCSICHAGHFTVALNFKSFNQCSPGVNSLSYVENISVKFNALAQAINQLISFLPPPQIFGSKGASAELLVGDHVFVSVCIDVACHHTFESAPFTFMYMHIAHCTSKWVYFPKLELSVKWRQCDLVVVVWVRLDTGIGSIPASDNCRPKNGNQPTLRPDREGKALLI